MIEVQIEEFNCPHGHGWSWAAQDEGEIVLRGESKTMQEAISYIETLFEFMGVAFILRRNKRKKCG